MSIAIKKPSSLLNSVKRAIVMFQIRRLDRHYIQLNRDLDWQEEALKAVIAHGKHCRIAVLKHRSKLRSRIIELEGH
ncbi:hypothetical protein BH11PSE12_BH11PSE12_18450 [soil metagenome]